MALTFAVIGQSGQLVKALARDIPSCGHGGVFLDRAALDLSSSFPDIRQNIAQSPGAIDSVILAAAYTAADKAEDERELAMIVNGRAPGVIAEACAARGLPLVHISTDYVFSGLAGTPYPPTNATDPVNYYGASKLAGEEAIKATACTAAILRPARVFDGRGANFMNTMLRLAGSRDQIGRPTYAVHLAKAVIAAVEQLCKNVGPKFGVYHVSGSGEPVSRVGFAAAIFTDAQEHLDHTMTVTPIPSSGFPTPAARPAYSVMDLNAYEAYFPYRLPCWTEGLSAALAEKFTPHLST